MIRSTTYFVDMTNVNRPRIADNPSGEDSSQMPAHFRIQPYAKLNMDFTGGEIARKIDAAKELRTSRYAPVFFVVMPGNAVRTYGDMLAELADPRRALDMAMSIQEIEQLDDRDNVYVVTFYYTER